MKGWHLFIFASAVTIGLPVAVVGQTQPPGGNAMEPSSAIDPSRPPDTLMFSIDDLTDIQSRIAAGADGADGATDGSDIEQATLYLSTILYYGPRDWTAWINNVPIGPSQDFQSFQVTDIGANYVELVVPLSAQGMRPVRLAPNQTFIARTGTIVEGRWNP